MIQHRDTQFKHEVKKKEREINKLKERLHTLLVDKNQERKVGEWHFSESFNIFHQQEKKESALPSNQYRFK